MMGDYGCADAAELIARKRGGERIGLDPMLLDVWKPRIEGFFARLDEA
jgi:hypothetical protein